MKNDKSLDDKLLKFLSSDPDKAFETFEKMGTNFDDLKKLDMGRLLIKEKFKLSENQFEAVEFVFWISYMLERDLEAIIKDVEKARMLNLENPMLEAMLDKLHFGDKISLIQKHYATEPDDKNFNSLLWKINDLRNSVAHGRFDELKFGGHELHNPKGQLKLIIEVMKAFKKK